MHFSVEGMEVGLLSVRRNKDAADVLLKVSSARVGGMLRGTHLGAESLHQRVSLSSAYTMSPDMSLSTCALSCRGKPYNLLSNQDTRTVRMFSVDNYTGQEASTQVVPVKPGHRAVHWQHGSHLCPPAQTFPADIFTSPSHGSGRTIPPSFTDLHFLDYHKVKQFSLILQASLSTP